MNESHSATATVPSSPTDPAAASPATHHALDRLPSGTHGVVQHVDSTNVALHRLMAMGLCVGREIEVVRQGNPLIVRLLGARIGVSSRLARQIIVAIRPAGGN
jgi:Fe2+ transport system protein FeoA